MANVLIVCTANICRSPVVEALLRDRLNNRGLVDWKVVSVGTWAIYPRGASQYSIDVIRDWENLDISQHRARMVTQEDLAQSDLILTMEQGHAEALRIEFPAYAEKIYLLSQMVDDGQFNIADPYGLTRPYYEKMVAEVRRLVDEGLPQIINLANRKAEGN